jgi:ribosomal protein S18 acetylase RimI-like enzyme
MNVLYSPQQPAAELIWCLYDKLGWAEFLKLSAAELGMAMAQSWFVIYAYENGELIGTGRVVSDGVINAYICGVGVHPDFRGKGIGREIMRILVEQCEGQGLHIQFFCEQEPVPYYEKLGFQVFAAGMTRTGKGPQ